MSSKRLMYNQFMSFVQGECLLLYFFVQEFLPVKTRVIANQFTDLQSESIDWLLNDTGFY